MWQAGLGQLRRQHTTTRREGTREEFSERAITVLCRGAVPTALPAPKEIALLNGASQAG